MECSTQPEARVEWSARAEPNFWDCYAREGRRLIRGPSMKEHLFVEEHLTHFREELIPLAERCGGHVRGASGLGDAPRSPKPCGREIEADKGIGHLRVSRTRRPRWAPVIVPYRL